MIFFRIRTTNRLRPEPMIHPDRFGELVARNRGADARVFTVEAEALAWVRRLR
jgi:hypothetical protein